MSYRSKHRNLRGETYVSVALQLERGSVSDVTDMVQSQLSRVVDDRKLSAKEAARLIECSPRTVENWLGGRGGVSVELLREMARRFPEMRPAIRAFFFLESEIDPEVEKLLHVIMDHATKKVRGE